MAAPTTNHDWLGQTTEAPLERPLVATASEPRALV